jgi:hypothetical protein
VVNDILNRVKETEEGIWFNAGFLGRCLKYQVIRALGVEVKKGGMETYFQRGHLFERRVEEALAVGGGEWRLICGEVVLYNRELRLRDMSDGIIEIGGERYILEVKSMGADRFEWYRERGWKEMWWAEQVVAHCLVSKGGVLLIVGGDGEVVGEIIKLDSSDELVIKVVNELVELNKMIMDEEFELVFKDDKECSYCEFKNICDKLKSIKEVREWREIV